MAEWTSFWGGLSGAARRGLVLGIVVILIGSGVAGWWLLRTKEAVLFSELSERDMAAMATEPSSWLTVPRNASTTGVPSAMALDVSVGMTLASVVISSAMCRASVAFRSAKLSTSPFSTAVT